MREGRPDDDEVEDVDLHAVEAALVTPRSSLERLERPTELAAKRVEEALGATHLCALVVEFQRTMDRAVERALERIDRHVEMALQATSATVAKDAVREAVGSTLREEARRTLREVRAEMARVEADALEREARG